MSATGVQKKGAASFEELKPACQILVLHEDFPSYSRAIEVCRRVLEQFAAELDFDIKCWNLVELADPRCARHAAKTAAAADLILLSLPDTKLPADLQRWLQIHFSARLKNTGLLVAVSNAPDTAASAEQLQSWLAPLARRLGLEFVAVLFGKEAAVQEIFSKLRPTRGSCK